MAIEIVTHDDGKVYLSADAAAVICGTTKVTLLNWRKMENPPPYDDELKLYPAAALGEWIRKEMIFKKGKGGSYPYLPDIKRFPGGGVMPSFGAPKPTVAISKHDAEIRLKTLQAQKVEIELEEMAGRLVPVDQVTTALTNMITRVKTKLLRIPTAVAPLVVGVSDVYAVQERIEDGVREALEELSSNWRDTEDEPDE